MGHRGSKHVSPACQQCFDRFGQLNLIAPITLEGPVYWDGYVDPVQDTYIPVFTNVNGYRNRFLFVLDSEEFVQCRIDDSDAIIYNRAAVTDRIVFEPEEFLIDTTVYIVLKPDASLKTPKYVTGVAKIQSFST